MKRNPHLRTGQDTNVKRNPHLRTGLDTLEDIVRRLMAADETKELYWLTVKDGRLTEADFKIEPGQPGGSGHQGGMC